MNVVLKIPMNNNTNKKVRMMFEGSDGNMAEKMARER